MRVGNTQGLRRISDRLRDRVMILNRQDFRRLAAEGIHIMLSEIREEIRYRRTMPVSTTLPERTAA